MPLPTNLIQEKNKVATASAWVILLKISLDGSEIRLTNNNEDIVYNSLTYTKFPFEFLGVSQDLTGSIPTLDLRVSNVTRDLIPYLKTYSGLIGYTVTIIFFNTAYPNEDYSDLTYNFLITNTSFDEQNVIFKLSIENPLFKRFPKDTFIADYCNWTYGSIECGHSGSKCNRTLDRDGNSTEGYSCRQLNNSHRFGGFPGLSRLGFKIARR